MEKPIGYTGPRCAKVLIVLRTLPPRPSVPTKRNDQAEVLLFFKDNKLHSSRVAYCSPRVTDFRP